MFADDALNKNYPNLAAYTMPLKPAERRMIGRESELRQLQAAMARPELCNPILLGEAGAGKSLADDTLIPVYDQGKMGYSKMKDLKVGDFVFDDNGFPTEILGVYPQGYLQAYRVTFTDGTSVVCNDEHLWAVRAYWQHERNGGNTGFYQVKSLKEIMERGITHRVNRKSRSYDLQSWYIPICEPLARPEMKYAVHPYVVGVLIGDGCTTESSIALTISSSDEILVSHVADLLGATGYKAAKYSYNWTFVDGKKCWNTESNLPRIYIQSRSLSECEDLTGVMGCYAGEKRIPRQYMIGSIEQRWELLRGLMDTDGTIINDDQAPCSFSTTSEGLANDVRELASSLGIRTTLTSQDRRGEDSIHKSIEYHVHFSIEYSKKQLLFWLPRKKEIAERHAKSYNEKFKFRKIYDDMSIAKVEDLGMKMPMTCIYVDSPNHCFLCTENHIVTHNTALVQESMRVDTERLYLEVDLTKMLADVKADVNEMANKLKMLFDEAIRYRKEQDKELVMFIDEFHQIVQLSAAAVEALKPILADSGTRGLRIIAATTYVEFRKYISSNQPLVERLQRINISQATREMVVSILRSYSKRYGVDHQFFNNKIFEMIYEYTNRYVPANAQPRKSILLLDSMIGWHRAFGLKMDMKLLANVLYETEGVNVAFRVDPRKIKDQLDSRVYAQQFATSVIEQRLQVCVADLNNKTKPMSSFLFTGSTGVGKGLLDSTLIPVYLPDGTISHKRNGDLKVGDYVLNRKRQPVKVTGVFHRGLQDLYKVSLEDGRSLITDSSHLWTCRSMIHMNGQKSIGLIELHSTQELLETGIGNEGQSWFFGDEGFDWYVPVSHDGSVDYYPGMDFGDDKTLKDFDQYWIRIQSIRHLDRQDHTTCIMVDDDEHLYLAGDDVITHNTETTKALAEILFNDDRNLIRFDMTEYANEDSLDHFRHELTSKMWEHPYSILLLDEIEKSCAPVTRLLLQVLDDGRLIDENNREVSFINSYIIMTTNAGSEIYDTIAQYSVSDTGSGEGMKKFDKAIRRSIISTTGANKFPPELLGRIDCIVPFQPLSEATQKKIVQTKLLKMRDEVMDKHNVTVHIRNDVIRYLIEDNLDTEASAGGARAVVAKMESEVLTQVARFINMYPDVPEILVSVGGTLAADDKHKLESEAYIRVTRALRSEKNA